MIKLYKIIKDKEINYEKLEFLQDIVRNFYENNNIKK